MKHILKQGVISKLEGGDSGETFLVKFAGKSFVLRKYETKKEADYNILIHKKLKKYGFFPELYYQEGNNVLFEYIKGRNCKKSDALSVAKQVGKICARINQLKINSVDYEEKNVASRLKILQNKSIVSREQAVLLEKKYVELKRKVKPKIAIDFDDIYPENFRLKKGRIYLVDIEGFELKIKGRGIGKGFLRWFKTPMQRERFKRGYASVASLGFLTKAYLQFLYLDFTIKNIAYKIRRKKEMRADDLDRLLRFINNKRVE